MASKRYSIGSSPFKSYKSPFPSAQLIRSLHNKYPILGIICAKPGGDNNLYAYARQSPIRFTDPSGLTVSCWYSQSTGYLSCYDDDNGQYVVNESGYAGNGTGLNNPDAEDQQDVGPIPRGDYTLDEGENRPHTGQLSIPITPEDGTDTHGRSGFYIHGDNPRGNHSASHGCIILGRHARQEISNRGGGTLTVTE